MKRKKLICVLAAVFQIVALAIAPQKANADVIFQDGFETGDVTDGGWTYSGDLTVDSNAYSGDYAARIDDSGYLQKVISTVGYDTVYLQYARYTYGYDWQEMLTVQWSSDGSNWYDVEQYDGGWGVNQVQLDAAAGQQDTLYLRFVSNAVGSYERFRIDAVEIRSESGGTQPSSCLPEVSDYTSPGDFDYTYRSVGAVRMWVPDDLPANCRVPIIHLANGTGASCFMYGDILRHYASHGFIAACYENSNTGQGTQAIEAIETVIAEYPDLVDTKYGFTGHSQGGGGAIMGVYRAEAEWGNTATYAGFAIEPAHGFGNAPINWQSYYSQIQSPVSMFNGSRDGLVSAIWVRSGYLALDDNLEKVWYEAVGAGHMTPVPQDYASEFGLAWFRWQLLGDASACHYFKDMPNTSSYWRLQEADNLSSCE